MRAERTTSHSTRQYFIAGRPHEVFDALRERDRRLGDFDNYTFVIEADWDGGSPRMHNWTLAVEHDRSGVRRSYPIDLKRQRVGPDIPFDWHLNQARIQITQNYRFS